MNAHTFYRHRWMLIRVPLLLAGTALAMLFWLWLYPIPSARITLSSGLPGGAYQLYAARYAKAFARYGVEVNAIESAGSSQNLARLRSDVAAEQADIAFVQGGFGWSSLEEASIGQGKVQTLVGVDIEALWLFTRFRTLQDLEDLRGLRVAVGPEGSGHHVLFDRMLSQQRIEPSLLQLSPLTGLAARDALLRGELDAVFMVASPNAPAVAALMSAPGVVLASLHRTAGMADRNNFLDSRLLPKSSIGPLLPPQDVSILTTQTHLLARNDLDPALKRLATAVAIEVHQGDGIFHRAGEYPLLRSSDFPAAPESRQVLKRGLGAFEQYIPFVWLQSLQRLLIICLPIASLALLLGWLLPLLLRWQLESRVTRWYGELKYIEHDLARDAINLGGIELKRMVSRIRLIDQRVNAMKLPPELAQRWYTLRQHISFVKTQVKEYRGR